MKLHLLFPAFLLSIVLTATGQADDFTIRFAANGEELAVSELSLNGDAATVKTEDVVEAFDLKDQRWQDDETKEWVTLAQCEKWAEQSVERSKKSLKSAPAKIRTLAEWTLDPQFEVAEEEDALTLKSGQVDYKIAGKKSDRDLTNYFRYMRLNAYKKAMTQKKLAPFAELKVIDELEKRKFMPTTMEVAIPGVEGSPLIKVTIEEK